MTIEEKLQFLKGKYESVQNGLSADEICIRPGLKFKITEASRFGFEFFCWRSPEEMALEMDCFVKYVYGRKRLVDIGAFHGIFSLVFNALNKGSESYAFEPSPDPFNILVENSKLNPDLKIHPVRLALSDDANEILMGKEWDHYVQSDKGVLVKSSSGDGYFSNDLPTPMQIDVIKVDVEGMELKALNGFKQTIEAYHPVIFLELHLTKLSEEEAWEVIRFVGKYDYMILDSRTDSIADLYNILKEKTDLRLILL